MKTPPPSESKERLWAMPASPTIWAVHFLATYATVATWCGRWAGPSRTMGLAGWAVAALTLIALVLIAIIGWSGYRAHRRGAVPHDADSPEDRHRFVGLATLLLSALSALAVVYSGLAVWLSGICL